jgi:hypothetical protein
MGTTHVTTLTSVERSYQQVDLRSSAGAGQLAAIWGGTDTNTGTSLEYRVF